MKIEFITREIAAKRYEETKGRAFSIAEANGKLPGECSYFECKEWLAYASLLSSRMREGGTCLFIDGLPAYILTDFEVERGKKVIGKIFAENITEASVENNILSIKYADGVVEYFRWLENLNCWKYKNNNVGNVKLAQRGAN